MESHAEGADDYLDRIKEVITSEKGKGKVVAVGECGLDYDRLHFSPADVQKKHFATQLDLAVEVKLPLFLHSRAAHREFVDILKPRIGEIDAALKSNRSGEHNQDASAKRVGVVHSFTGTIEEVKELLELGYSSGSMDVRSRRKRTWTCCSTSRSHGSCWKQMHLGAIPARPTLPIPTSNPSSSHTGVARALPTSLRQKGKMEPNSMVKGRNEPASSA